MLTFAGTITLAETLLVQDSSQDPKSVQDAHARLAAAIREAKTDLVSRQRHLANNESTRSVDDEADNAWRALYEGLTTVIRLPEKRFPHVKTARYLLGQLFPDGNLDFLRLRYVDQYSMMQAKVDQIKEDGHLPALLELLGPSFWQEILHTLEEYRKMVKAGLEPSPDESNLGEQMRKLRLRISDFATKVVALADVDDPNSLEAIEQRLAAIPRTRASVRARRHAIEQPTDTAETT